LCRQVFLIQLVEEEEEEEMTRDLNLQLQKTILPDLKKVLPNYSSRKTISTLMQNIITRMKKIILIKSFCSTISDR